jgi:hypothetical protein
MMSHFVVRREPLCAAFIGNVAQNPRAELKGPDMLMQRMILSVVLSTGGLLVQGAAVAQDNRGTMEQQMACTPDVMRLCGAQIPDIDRIVACLRYNVPQLSPQCRAVFEPADSTQAQPPRRGDRTARISR